MTWKFGFNGHKHFVDIVQGFDITFGKADRVGHGRIIDQVQVVGFIEIDRYAVNLTVLGYRGPPAFGNHLQGFRCIGLEQIVEGQQHFLGGHRREVAGAAGR